MCVAECPPCPLLVLPIDVKRTHVLVFGGVWLRARILGPTCDDAPSFHAILLTYYSLWPLGSNDVHAKSLLDRIAARHQDTNLRWNHATHMLKKDATERSTDR